MPSRELSDLRVSLLIALACLLVYNANARVIGAGDTYPARYLPFGIWQHQSLALDPIATVTAQGRGDGAFWMVRAPSGHLISLYPVVLPVMLAPLYLPAAAYLDARGWPEGRLDYIAGVMEKVCASLIAALSAALLYLLLRRRAARPAALLLTAAYAFGTTTWMISSQALWQHGFAQLLIIGALLCLTSPCTRRRALLAGVLCGLVAANRPPDLIIAAALGAFGLSWAKREAAWLAAGAALPMALVLFYNVSVAGGAGGAYFIVGRPSYLQHDLWAGLGGLLFSPARGLFVFSPFLVFLALVWRHIPAAGADRRLTFAMIAAVLLQLVLYAKADWRGGESWGPRYLTDLLPLMIWMLVPVVAALRGAGRIAFMAMVGVAIAIEGVGAFCYVPRTDKPIVAIAEGPGKMRAAWDWRNAPVIVAWSQGLAPRELLTDVRGRFDAVQVDGETATTVIAGQRAVLSGWALAGGATPWKVAVIVDGKHALVTRTFVDRPDVRKALGVTSAAGWLIALDTTGLAPGEHHLAAYAWASEKGDPHFLSEHTITVQAEPSGGETPAGRVETALARLRFHQKAPGYWLTAHTRTTAFEAPQAEMNTFVTAMLVDLLAPLAATGKLTAELDRARRHLTDQIEDGGLVRYHGRPDGPGIGRLGCAITPDADDTALVWRIAPDRDRRKLTAALATLDRYRTPDGLYRTWLAPRAEYQCIDPGGDPNPPDIAIQMHLLQLLAVERPAAGGALCEALRQTIDDDRIWVYYHRAPLVPILRLADLEAAGCALALPPPRTRTAVQGQEIWVTVVRLIDRARRAGLTPAEAAEARAALDTLAKDGFALLRSNPPLLYHNDLSATVPRYYWSEDVGYALWLLLETA